MNGTKKIYVQDIVNEEEENNQLFIGMIIQMTYIHLAIGNLTLI